MTREPLDDEKLAATLVHGPTPTSVEIVDYDPEWPRRFARRAAELRELLGERARLIEHIGSTSVPGLAAKPVVDIVVGIDDPDDEPAYLRRRRATWLRPEARRRQAQPSAAPAPPVWVGLLVR
ncbi:GrpB-like predicted nucleotidyltransferase (UPF0157 family) [Prauserella isguenensis]|uniref:GrpB-like predicted nucleotidyltransferase (UPF0157 family) n=1 Tax=Prauserella isguenensis TaxID=1470180 RepID=A0A839RXN2_9PSEU|nr:GrpB family protein [Prauserella isguenensis]MBB3049389.1 GrpB-like predicted nucleotidyltransferase (UPF0157 family) [Prauserella isguenensis]